MRLLIFIVILALIFSFIVETYVVLGFLKASTVFCGVIGVFIIAWGWLFQDEDDANHKNSLRELFKEITSKSFFDIFVLFLTYLLESIKSSLSKARNIALFLLLSFLGNVLVFVYALKTARNILEVDSHLLNSSGEGTYFDALKLIISSKENFFIFGYQIFVGTVLFALSLGVTIYLLDKASKSTNVKGILTRLSLDFACVFIFIFLSIFVSSYTTATHSGGVMVVKVFQNFPKIMSSMEKIIFPETGSLSKDEILKELLFVLEQGFLDKKMFDLLGAKNSYPDFESEKGEESKRLVFKFLVLEIIMGSLSAIPTLFYFLMAFPLILAIFAPPSLNGVIANAIDRIINNKNPVLMQVGSFLLLIGVGLGVLK
ncbi:MAG: hypothetical protein HOJ79_08675 [Nitrospina sp.]|jgi:hypothetical protein|nr:hypothetical protein [Nitrospina sp.]